MIEQMVMVMMMLQMHTIADIVLVVMILRSSQGDCSGRRRRHGKIDANGAAVRWHTEGGR